VLPDLETWLAWRASVLEPPPYAPSGYDARGYIRDLLLIMQGGRCALCLSGWPDELDHDHDHATDMVRGLVHGMCNKREAGALKRERAGGPGPHPVIAAYRARPPAQGAGWLYWGPAAPDWTSRELMLQRLRLGRAMREIDQQAHGETEELRRASELRLFAAAFGSWTQRLNDRPEPTLAEVHARLASLRRTVRLGDC
jgi:hypothetical protein